MTLAAISGFYSLLNFSSADDFKAARYADEQLTKGRHFSHFSFPGNPTSVLPFGGCTGVGGEKWSHCHQTLGFRNRRRPTFSAGCTEQETSRRPTLATLSAQQQTQEKNQGQTDALQQEAESCSWQRAIGSSIYIRLAASHL
jgi:hypothetical protein